MARRKTLARACGGTLFGLIGVPEHSPGVGRFWFETSPGIGVPQ
jgi:hypothetical protein